MYVRRRRRHRTNQLGLRINTNMALHTKVPLLAFLRLVHLRVALFALVLGRGRRVNDGRIHNRTGTDFQTVLLKILVNQLEQTTPQVVSLQQKRLPACSLSKTFKTIVGERLLKHYDPLPAASIDGLYYNRSLNKSEFSKIKFAVLHFKQFAGADRDLA